MKEKTIININLIRWGLQVIMKVLTMIQELLN